MEKIYPLRNNQEAKALFGKHDENLKLMEKEFKVKLISRGENLLLVGEKEGLYKMVKLLDELLGLIKKGRMIKRDQILYAAKEIQEGKSISLSEIYSQRIEVSSKRQYVLPKTKTQKEYVEAIKNYDIVFGIGPAGTGKTYLAMASAVENLKKEKVSRIILTRPAVEAGESLGFLPGTLYEKITPYLRPLYDALYDMVEVDKIEAYLDKGIIEVAPLAYMRGRTLNDAFIILDEAQNATPEQIKMFLTRLGFDSKTVITGDITQSDLPGGKPLGLLQAKELLEDIEGIEFIYFTGKDVVRHELVQEIIKAYARIDKTNS